MKYIAVVFTIFIVGVIILADRNALPPFIRAVYDFPNGDKLGHFILFGLLNFFITRAVLASFPSRPRGRLTLSVGLILALLVTLEEYSQKFYPSRTFDLIDLLASCMGLLVGGWTAFRLKKRGSLSEK
jgi:polysaccharide biosynthesis protein VpsQ